MYGYNSVGMMNDGAIKVEIEENTPITASFSKEEIKVGNMTLPTPSKNKEIVIKIILID